MANAVVNEFINKVEVNIFIENGVQLQVVQLLRNLSFELKLVEKRDNPLSTLDGSNESKLLGGGCFYACLTQY